MAVPQFRKEFGEVIQGIDDVPDPQLLGQILEVMDLIPAERWKQQCGGDHRGRRASCSEESLVTSAADE